MKDQLKLLEELQRHDAQLQELDGSLKAIPERLKALRNELKKVDDLLERERAQLAETERYHTEQTGALKNEEQMVQKAKVKLQAVKNSKEYMATQRELETTRKMSQEREEEVYKLLGAIDEFKKNIAAHEQDVSVVREHVTKEEEETREEMAKLEAQVAEARKFRDEVAAKVRPDVLRRYSSIKLRRGLAVVAVKNGTCLGCHMNIPPQLYNTLQRGGTMETCPNCHRIIYWDKLMEEGASAGSEQKHEQPGPAT